MRDWRPKVPQRVAGYFSERRLLKWIVLTGVASFLAGYVLVWLFFFPGFGRSAIVTVPDLRGRTLQQADRALERMGLEAERGDSLNHPTVAKGRVIAQEPLPGQEVTRGADVTVLVSLGPELRRVPPVAGLSREEAISLLQRMGFEVAVRRVRHMQAEGRIVGMDPRAGSQAAAASRVTLMISSGPPWVQAPSVLTLPPGEARAQLEAAGLRLGRIRYDSLSAEPLGGIASQSPAPGDSIRMGSAVSVVVSGSDPNPPPPPEEVVDSPTPDEVTGEETPPEEGEEGEPEEEEPEPAEPPARILGGETRR
jgi:eukaryotic-like serine/threonine-protein kinase